MPDRIPAVCRLDIWYRAQARRGAFPAGNGASSLEAFQLGLGMGVSARKGRVFSTEFQDPVRHETRVDDTEIVELWHAPSGTLKKVYRRDRDREALGMLPAVIEYPIKTAADMRIYQEVIAAQEYVPQYSAFEEYDRGIGDRGCRGASKE